MVTLEELFATIGVNLCCKTLKRAHQVSSRVHDALWPARCSRRPEDDDDVIGVERFDAVAVDDAIDVDDTVDVDDAVVGVTVGRFLRRLTTYCDDAHL